MTKSQFFIFLLFVWGAGFISGWCTLWSRSNKERP